MLLRCAVLFLALFGLSGCAALPLTALGAAAVSGGATSAARAGTEYTFAGTARRTVSQPMDVVLDSTLDTLRRLGVKITTQEHEESGAIVLHAEAYQRSVKVTLEPVTPMMTRFGVAVRRYIARDGATAAEIMTQLEHALERRNGQASPP